MTDIGYVACSLEAKARGLPSLYVVEPEPRGRHLWAINAVGHGHDGEYCKAGPAYEFPAGVITHTTPELHLLRLRSEALHEKGCFFCDHEQPHGKFYCPDAGPDGYRRTA